MSQKQAETLDLVKSSISRLSGKMSIATPEQASYIAGVLNILSTMFSEVMKNPSAAERVTPDDLNTLKSLDQIVSKTVSSQGLLATTQKLSGLLSKFEHHV